MLRILKTSWKCWRVDTLMLFNLTHWGTRMNFVKSTLIFLYVQSLKDFIQLKYLWKTKVQLVISYQLYWRGFNTNAALFVYSFFFCSSGDLRKHYAIHSGKAEELLQCDQCNKSFATQKCLVQHKTTHNKGNDQIWMT